MSIWSFTARAAARGATAVVTASAAFVGTPVLADGVCLVSGSCFVTSASSCAGAGGSFLTFAPNCEALPCGTSSNGCFVDNLVGAGCSIAFCCYTVCQTDPFCCANTWDIHCALAAVEVCGGCGTADAGTCFSENGSPGCDQLECCSAICSADSFCCSTQWDALCAAQANESCGGCGSAASGSCLVSNGSPACRDADCCTLVCAADPFCCETTWDTACASQARSTCCTSQCTGDLDGNGRVDGADLGLLLAAWNTTDLCADLDGDGVVNGADLGILLQFWGQCIIID